MTFEKSLFLTKYRMRYAIYIPPNTKDLAINQTMVAYGNRQNAITFARANNSDFLRTLKHLIETRLYGRWTCQKVQEMSLAKTIDGVGPAKNALGLQYKNPSVSPSSSCSPEKKAEVEVSELYY